MDRFEVKIFIDSNVLLAAVLRDHGSHARAFSLLERIQSGKDDGYVAAHSLAEMYSALTRMPAPFRHSPDEALQSVEENVVKYFHVIALTAGDYVEVLRSVVARGVHGGATYDALILKAAEKAKVSRIFTFNLKHFEAIADQRLAELLVSP